MLTYNPENKTYSRFIPVEQLEEMKEKMRSIEERLKNTPINPPYTYETEEELDIDDMEGLNKFLETEKFNINMSINRRRASLFLVACYFTDNKDVLEFLIAQGSEINRTDIFGYNAIMSVVLNENMDDQTNLGTIQMLIDKGCDVNWLNYQCETALTLALERVEIDIANLLLDNGAFLYRN
ncbi:MAG: ankyrin repeat domain-containing protein [Alphaproteobacteria bacterium]|nr:ankyrin repeat domain-containing protein [Alphaproteobacteria bacterium]